MSKSENIVLEYPLQPSELGDGVNVTASVRATVGVGVDVELSATSCPVETDNLASYGRHNCDFMGVPYDGHPRDYASQMGAVNFEESDGLPY